MNREFLKQLGIEDKETIDKILNKRGDELESVKKERDELKQALNEEKTKVNNLSNEQSEIENVKKELEEYKNKYNQTVSELEDVKKSNAVEIALLNAGANDVDYLTYKLGDIDELEQLDDKINQLKTDYSKFFDNDEPKDKEQESDNTGFKVVDNKLKQGDDNHTKTKEEILKIKDKKERQKQIAENLDLFR